MRALRPRDFTFLLFAFAVGAACLRLGFWQLDRLAERRQANAEVRAKQSMPPVNLNAADAVTASDAFRPAEARGSFDLGRQVLLSNRSLNGQPGMHWVVPLRLQGRAEAILVDRGWLPLSETGTDRLASLPSSGTAEIRGVLLPTQIEPRWGFMADRLPSPGQPPLFVWRVLSIPGLQAQMPYPLLALYLAAAEPPSGSPLPKPDFAIDLSEGSHLSYAIQWFAFCAIAWIGAGVYAHRRTRTSKQTPQER
jgi:surfeit locus 1 family protein